MDLLLLDRVSKRFGPADPPAVDGLSLRVAEGEILALLGPSGCGKTTTLRLIAGLESPDAGTITLRGQVVAGPGRAVPPEERGIGIVFQDYALFPHLTVADNVAFGLPRDGATGARVEPVLDLVGLGGFGARYPHELSGGQQQRVALARALAPAPALMLLDEPFSNLDADLRAQMRDEVERILRTSGTTAVFVTHDQEEAFTLADRVGVLQAGRIEQLAPPQELYHRPATRFVAAFVGAADFLPGLVTAEGIVTEVGTFANVDQLPSRRAGRRDDPARRHHLRAAGRRRGHDHPPLLPGLGDGVLHPPALGRPGALVPALRLGAPDRHAGPRRSPRPPRRRFRRGESPTSCPSPRWGEGIAAVEGWIWKTTVATTSAGSGGRPAAAPPPPA